MKNRPQKLIARPLLLAGAGLTAAIAGCVISNPQPPDPPTNPFVYCGGNAEPCDMANSDAGPPDGGGQD